MLAVEPLPGCTTGTGAAGKENGAVAPTETGDAGSPVVPGAGLVAAEAGLAVCPADALDEEPDGDGDADADEDGDAEGDGLVTLTGCPACGYEPIDGVVEALAIANMVSELMVVADGTCTCASSSYGDGAPPGVPSVPITHDDVPAPLGQLVNVAPTPDASVVSHSPTPGSVPGPCVHTLTAYCTVLPLVTLD